MFRWCRLQRLPLEALKAYSLGGKASREKGADADLPYTLRAIELDPNFAAAYEAVGGDYFSLAKDEEGRKYITKAFQLRGMPATARG
jgi:hypothetical protein